MEEQKSKFDIVLIVTMTIVALMGDLFSFFALLVGPLPVIGELVFAGALVFDLLINVAIGAIFIWKKERSPAVWSILLPGLAFGELLPTKFLVVLLTTHLSNFLERHAWIKLAADTVASGGEASLEKVAGEAATTAVQRGASAMGLPGSGLAGGAKGAAKGTEGAAGAAEASGTAGVNLEEPAQAFERIGLTPEEEPYGITPEVEPQTSFSERLEKVQDIRERLGGREDVDEKEGENTFKKVGGGEEEEFDMAP